MREALHRLEAEGLIRFVPNQGAFVSSLGVEEAEETFELRAMLEAYVVKLCAKRATPEQLATLRTLAEGQLTASQERKPSYLQRIADFNSRFHDTLLEACGSEPLRATMGTLANAPLVFQTFRDYSQNALVRSARHHLEIVHGARGAQCGLGGRGHACTYFCGAQCVSSGARTGRELSTRFARAQKKAAPFEAASFTG